MGKLDPRRPLRCYLKPRLPHMGLVRLQEPWAMDTIFPQGKKKGMRDFCGHTCSQTFVGMKSYDIMAFLLRF